MLARSLFSRHAFWLVGLSIGLSGLSNPLVAQTDAPPTFTFPQTPTPRSDRPEFDRPEFDRPEFEAPAPNAAANPPYSPPNAVPNRALNAPAMPASQGVIYNVQAANQRLEMIVNSSRILTLERPIPQAQVGNRELLDLTPLSATQVQVFAKRAGVTQINLWDDKNQIHAVDVVIFSDARELQLVLASQFPRASLKVTPLANSVVVSGYVDRPDQVSRIVQIAQDYHPNIINNITVGGVQQVLLDVKVMEVSRTDLRTLGVDLAYFSGNDFAISSVSGLITGLTQVPATLPLGVTPTETVTFGITNQNSAFFGVIEALRQKNLAKIVADPKIVTVSGRPARFLQGGEFPILVPQSLGTVSIEYRPYGTEVDFVPIVMGNGIIRLELRPRVSEPDPGLSVSINGTTVPALTIREVDTAVEMRAGQTLAIAGLVQQRVQATSRGIPWVSDVPYLGALFRRNSTQKSEVETLVLVTPQLVEAMDPHQVPRCGPGMNTDLPSDCELYLKGYLEVPRCCPPGQTHGVPPITGMPYRSMGPEEVAPPAGGMPAPPSPGPSNLPEVRQPAASPSDATSQRPRMPAQQPAAARAPAPARKPSTVTRTTAPSGTTASKPSNRQEPGVPPEPPPRRVQVQPISNPGFIGPTGYDDLN
jgi:pilus assembly protein CpaC